MSARVITPRRAWDSVSQAARDLGCHESALMRYLEPAGSAYRLVPLSERRLAEWRRTTYARAQRAKPTR